MFWVILAIIGACANAAYYIINKKLLQTIDAYVLAGGTFLSTAFFLIILSLIWGIPSLGALFIPAVLATSFLNILATTLTFRALKSSDISLAIPMISFTPLFLVGTAALILHEIPSAAGIAGIVIIVAGSYILNTAEEHEHITDPFRAMVKNPGVLSMLVVAFLYAVAINFDKMVVQNSDTVFGSGIVCFVLGSAFTVLSIVFRHPECPVVPAGHPIETTGQEMKISPGRWLYVLVPCLCVGSILTIESVTINTAYTQQIVPYVIAIKRMSILLIVLYGTFVFREKEIVRRLSGAGLMVFGAVLILLFP